MLFPRAQAISFLGNHRVRIELEDDVFSEIDLTEALNSPEFAALQDPATFTAAHIDAKGVITWPIGLALDPEALFLKLKLQQITIGAELTMSGSRWRCTDTGTRTVTAIKLEHDDDPSWYAGPPYAVAEHVLDEHDLEACELSAEHLTQARERMLSGRLKPHACSGLGLLRRRSEIHEPIWMTTSRDGSTRISRGDLVLDRRALDELAQHRGVITEMLDKRSDGLSRADVMRLHELFDALEAEHGSESAD